ncbi:hypothetical protein EFP27_13710 [Lacticaseibacillus paracasei]|nr:hypothetical protein [Lacticaseibacillus paracasei]
MFRHKRACQPRNLRIRTVVAMVKNRPSRPRPHMLRFLPGLVRAHEKTVDHKIDGFFDAF